MYDVDACDDYDPGWLTWMPAHTSRAAIGHAKKSNGELLSDIDWIGNHAVDAIAKAAAERVRVPAATRDSISRHSSAAMYWRANLGIRTYVSQNFSVEGVRED